MLISLQIIFKVFVCTYGLVVRCYAGTKYAVLILLTLCLVKMLLSDVFVIFNYDMR